MDHSDQPHHQPKNMMNNNDLMGASATNPAVTAVVDMVLSGVGASSSSSNGIFGGFLAFLSGEKPLPEALLNYLLPD